MFIQLTKKSTKIKTCIFVVFLVFLFFAQKVKMYFANDLVGASELRMSCNLLREDERAHLYKKFENILLL